MEAAPSRASGSADGGDRSLDRRRARPPAESRADAHGVARLAAPARTCARRITKVITEADPDRPKRGGWWQRAKATLTGRRIWSGSAQPIGEAGATASRTCHRATPAKDSRIVRCPRSRSKSSPVVAATPASSSMRWQNRRIVGEAPDVDIDVEGAVDGMEVADADLRQILQQIAPGFSRSLPRTVSSSSRRAERRFGCDLAQHRHRDRQGSAAAARQDGQVLPAEPASRPAIRSCSNISRTS